jgi:hypothetical protein
VVGEVVADERVEQLSVAAQVRVGQHDELPVTGRGRVPGRSGEVVEVAADERGGHEERCRGGVRGTLEDLGGSVGMVADQAVKESGVVVGHTSTVDRSADGTLTPRGRAPSSPPLEGRVP